MGKDKQINLPYPLILASTSKYRGELLSLLKWPFEAVAPGVDEDKVKQGDSTPKELASKLSVLKAQAVFVRYPNACVIGSDQVCSIGEQILSKPLTIDKACEQISLLQGKTHQLFTAVTIISPASTITFVNTTTLHMRKLTFKDIQQYIMTDLPLDCAGSYKLEATGIKLFEKIEMNDHTAVIGLPLIELTSTLLQLGYPLT